MRAEFFILPFFFAAPTLFGQDEKIDFSEGLSRIAALGLPDMKGAEWVKLPDSNEQRFTNSYELQEMKIQPSGNTWKLKTDPPTYIDFGSNQPIEPPKVDADSEELSSAKPSMLLKMLNYHKKPNPEEEKAAKPEDPEDNVALGIKDAAKMVESLGKAEAAENLNSSLHYSYSNCHGRLMLFAAQLHAAGQTESANALAAALFLATSDDSLLIDGAVSHLADNEYTKIASLFFETNDWQAYQKSLTALLKKFPRGWSNGPAVAMLVSNLEKRSTAPAKPSLPGIQLKPEAVALLDQLLVTSSSKISDEELTKEHGLDLSEYPPEHRGRLLAMLRAQGSRRGSSENLWLLNPSKTPEPGADAAATDKLKAMGMDGLIALATVANDPTLTPYPNSRDQDSYYSSDESPEENLQKRYLTLNRPASRGEIASAILGSVIPTPEGDPYSGNNQPDPAELGETAIAFWKANKNKSSIELATVYITEGNDSQKSIASTFLCTSKDPAAHTAFEKIVLASTDPVFLITQVDQYISLRKLEAKPFANAYIKLVQDNPPDEQQLMRNTSGYVIRQAGGLENYLKRLSLKVGDVSLDKMIADALKEKKNPEPDNDDPFSRRGRGESNSPIAALASSIQSIPINECLIAFGKAAKLATPEQWMEIHQVLLGRISRDEYSVEDGTPVEPEKNATTLPKEVIELWKPLLARTEPISKNQTSTYFIGYGAKTTGDASTLLLELITSPEMVYGLRSIAEIQESPTAIMEFARKRVNAWTSEQKPEPWPSSEIVSEDRQEEISTKLPTLKSDEIIPYAKSLNLNERLVLMGIIESFSEENSTPPNLLELRQVIVSLKPVFDQNHDAEAAAKLGIKVGDRLTPELITKISDDFLKEPAANSKTTVSFMPAFMNLGVALTVNTVKDLTKPDNEINMISYLAQTFQQHGNPDALSFIQSSNSGDARVIQDGKVVTLESEESALTEFTKELQAKAPYISYVIISILTREDAEKISNQE